MLRSRTYPVLLMAMGALVLHACSSSTEPEGPVSGKVIRVPTDLELLDALAAAGPGDTLALDPLFPVAPLDSSLVIPSGKSPLTILGSRGTATLTTSGNFPIFRWDRPRAGSTLQGLRLVGGSRQVVVEGAGALAIKSCRFEGGECHLFTTGDGLGVQIEESLFLNATIPALEMVGASNLMITQTTIHHPGSAGVILSGAGVLTMQRTIVNQAGTFGVVCDNGAVYGDSTRCNDVFGSGSANYSGCTPPEEDFSADPRFCDPDTGNFTLQSTSPCAPINSGGCDLVGALGPACDPVIPARGSPDRPPGSR